jgi:hypothetical protein
MRRFVRRLRRISLPTFVTIAALLGFAVAMFFVLRTQEGFDVTRDKVAWADVPADATRINYYIGSVLDGYTSLAFDTAEASFRQWVDSMQKPADATEEGGPFMVQLHVRDAKGRAALATIDVEDGLLFAWQRDGQYVRAAYDRQRGRAYYFANEH